MVKTGSTVALATSMFGAGRLNVHSLRPFIGQDGLSKISVNGKALTVNTPALLRYDEWKDIDRTVIEVAQERLVAVGDLMSAGLVHPLGSIGNTISLYERSSDITGAQVSMSGLNRSEEDTVEFDYISVPVPVVHKDFHLNLRRLEGSRLVGEPLDLVMPRMAARVVAEETETMLFVGNSIKVDSNSIYGYTNHPDRNTVTLSENWDAALKTGEEILDDVQAMLTAARADRFYGPFTLYIPSAYETVLDNDFNPGTSDTRTVRQRILQLNGIAQIKVADRCPAHTVVLVQLTSDVVDMAVAQDISTVSWQAMGGMQELFKVMAVWVPRVKSTYDGQMGLVVLAA